LVTRFWKQYLDLGVRKRLQNEETAQRTAFIAFTLHKILLKWDQLKKKEIDWENEKCLQNFSRKT
jgi:hypothetical protein